MGRIIGLVHRRKQTAEGEARPTMLAIRDTKGKITNLTLETETDELDFILGRYPIKHRDITPADELSSFHRHHIKWKKVKDIDGLPDKHLRKEGKDILLATKVPAVFDGLGPGDTLVMCLGGSGDRLAYAAAKQSSVSVLRLPPFVLKDKRGKEEKDNDPKLLVELALSEPERFQQIEARDLGLIRLTEIYRSWQEAMKARIACEQRLYQRLVGKIFLSEEGGYPEGTIEDQFDAAKANDLILRGLVAEENTRAREMEKVLQSLPVWKIFEAVEGCGPKIAARLIVSIGDIRRFSTKAKLRAYCGVHVGADGSFVRKRAGAVANWNNEGRQALFLIADQFNRRPDSEWGQKLREVKANYRQVHPEPVKRPNKQGKEVTVYSDGHIHKMSLWRASTKFLNHLYSAWWALEGGKLPVLLERHQPDEAVDKAA